jgi:DHA1 family multidrug resistance protein-like MFS transporter
MTAELLRDTLLGHSFRQISGVRIFPYAENMDSELWKRYVHREKSGRMAHHGNTMKEKKEEEG